MKSVFNSLEQLSNWINAQEYDDYEVLWFKSITIENLIEEAYPFESQTHEKIEFADTVGLEQNTHHRFELLIDRYLNHVFYNYIPEHAEYSEISRKQWRPISSEKASMLFEKCMKYMEENDDEIDDFPDEDFISLEENVELQSNAVDYSQMRANIMENKNLLATLNWFSDVEENQIENNRIDFDENPSLIGINNDILILCWMN